ncbi:MAG TPA: Calx-beta domain-containing protein [Anaerolineales bacterium]|nr:Calx-beta domain-containing protein [Anaerolineales bacterium]
MALLKGEWSHRGGAMRHRWPGTTSPRLGFFLLSFALLHLSPAPLRPPASDAVFISQSAPSALQPGETTTVSVTFENTGTSTWDPEAEYWLGSQNPENNSTWGIARVALDGPIAPEEQVTFSFSITAPGTDRVYDFQWQMVQDGVAWFGDLTPNLRIKVAAPANGARYVSQSAPAMILPGDTAEVSVTMVNNGTSTWDPAADYFLGSQNPENNWTWGLTRVPLDAPVEPGMQKTFTFSITSPSTPGTNNFQWQMVQEGVEWFGDSTPNLAIQSGSTDDGAEFVRQLAPLSLRPGEERSVSVTMRNVGQTAWTAAEGYALGSQNPQDNLTWQVGRVALPDGEVVERGEEGSFDFVITAPTTPDTYDFQWQMVQDGVAWFGDLTPNLRIKVAAPANGARYVSQSAPEMILPGDTAEVSVTMVNNGTSTWDPAADYFLGSQNPENNWTWGLARVPLDAPVEPGMQKTFTFSITSPSTPGTNNFQWQMVQEGVEWFGDSTPNLAIQSGSTDDGAQIVSHTLPDRMLSGQAYDVVVVMRNTGISTWTRDGDGPADGSRGFKLAVKFSNTIPIGTRYLLPPGLEVEPKQTAEFRFTVVAPFEDLSVTDLQMIHEGFGWFGETLSHSAETEDAVPPHSTIVLNAASGPPGTSVEVNWVEGDPFHPLAEVRFSFGDPEAHDYSRVRVSSTWVSASQLTFTVPPDASCGSHFATVVVPSSVDAVIQSKPVEFVVTSPCNPERRNSLDVLSYNVNMLPTAQRMDYRAGLIGTHPDLKGHDVIVFVELMSDSHRDLITWLLRSEYPYQGRILGRDHWGFPFPALVPLPIQDGGVIILSKWPIEAEAQSLFGAVCTPIPDCLGDKGVNYARINKAGQRYHIFGTHLDSGPDAADMRVRKEQFDIMSRFVLTRRIASGDPVIMAGDFNVDRNFQNGEYQRMLSALSATQPWTSGLQPATNPKGQWLDYVLFSNAYRPPESSLNRVVSPRDGNGADLSDHYAVLGKFSFSFSEELAASCSTAPAESPLAAKPSGILSDPWQTFSWNEIPGADSYTVSVIRAGDGVTLFHRKGIADTTFTPDFPLPSGIDLRFLLSAVNSCGEGPSSIVTEFRIARNDSSAPTEAPVPNWPGGLIHEARPTFSWTPVEGVTSYTLHVLSANDESVVLSHNNIRGTSFAAPTNLPSGALYWTVGGENQFGSGPYSPRIRFRVEDPSNPNFTLVVAGPSSCQTPCSVKMTAIASNPEGDPLAFRWSGCASGSSSTGVCVVDSEGTVQAVVQVSSAHGVLASASKPVLGIRPPDVSISDLSVVEGDHRTTPAEVTLSLSRASDLVVTVNFSTFDGTATGASNDYVPTSGTVSFPPGTTSQTITVVVAADARGEANETFGVRLSNPSNAVLTRGEAQVTILDDDKKPNITINNARVSEGAGAATFSVSFDGADFPATVAYATVDDTATAGSDYTATSGILTFDPGVTAQSIIVPILQDTVYDGTKRFRVVLSSATRATIVKGEGKGVIVDDEASPLGAPRADFNGDGKPDLLWRNAATGVNFVWLMDGTKVTGGARLPTASIEWRIVGTSDFNADGSPDIVWRNTSTGDNFVWYMSGVTLVGGDTIRAVPDLDWNIVGVADFNRDGKPDLLWRQLQSGSNAVWTMDGVTPQDVVNVEAVPDTSWTVGAPK